MRTKRIDVIQNVIINLASGPSDANPYWPNGKRHRAKRANRREQHQDIDHAKHRVRKPVEHIHQRFAPAAHGRQRKPEQHRNEDHLQNIA